MGTLSPTVQPLALATVSFDGQAAVGQVADAAGGDLGA